MSSKIYRVLWIDDEHEKMGGLKMQAFQNSIKFTPFKSKEAGLAELECNYFHYDAVLLDAKFYENEDDVAGSEGLSALRRTKDRILQLSKKFEPFIFTGQALLYEDQTFNDFIPKYYRKGIPQDVQQLFLDLKASADRQEDTQIRHEHQELFSIFMQGQLPLTVEQQLLELIKSPLPTNRFDIKAMLSNIRSIHESCFLKLEEINVIPDSEASFNSNIKHLSGNKSPANGFEPTTIEYQNDAIENLHKWLYFTCGKYIHNLKNENYKGYMISKYAVESLRSGLLELLLWFKKTYEENK